MNKKLLKANIIAVILAMILNRYLSNKYGYKSTIIIISIAVGIMISAYLCLIYMKQYYAVLAISSFVLPSSIIYIGILLNNIYLVITGLLLLMILLPIAIGILKKKRKN
ncbi:MAG: hypothetical protein WCQ54_13165 [Clostridiaceae bacterium]